MLGQAAGRLRQGSRDDGTGGREAAAGGRNVGTGGREAGVSENI